MKRILFFSLLLVSAFSTKAQLTTLNENFNISCATSPSYAPAGWLVHNPIVATIPMGRWMCSGTDGEDYTPGVECTGDYAGAYNTDTSLLITPLLDVHGYSGRVYLNFDSRASYISGERLSVIQPVDTSGTDTSGPLTISPVIGPNDSLGWVTHQVDLTPFKSLSGFYIAFRYTSTNTYGTKWYLDNIYTTTFPLGIATVTTQRLPLAVMGNATNTQVTISYSVASGGNYDVELYDMLGRTLAKRSFTASTGTGSYTITDLRLAPGMYFIKMGNALVYGTTKAIVP